MDNDEQDFIENNALEGFSGNKRQENKGELEFESIKASIDSLLNESVDTCLNIEEEIKDLNKKISTMQDLGNYYSEEVLSIFENYSDKTFVSHMESTSKLKSELNNEKAKINEILDKNISEKERNILNEKKVQIKSILDHIAKSRNDLSVIKEEQEEYFDNKSYKDNLDNNSEENVSEKEELKKSFKVEQEDSDLNFESINNYNDLVDEIKKRDFWKINSGKEYSSDDVIKKVSDYLVGINKNFLSVDDGLRKAVFRLKGKNVGEEKMSDTKNNKKENLENKVSSKITGIIDSFEDLSAKSEDYIAKKYLFYNDVYNLPEDSLKPEEYPAMIKYASSLKKMSQEEGFVEAVNQIRKNYEEVKNSIGLGFSKISDSQSWIYWDLAKQNYYFENDDVEKDPKYKIGDPLNDSDILNEITFRHLGYDFYSIKNLDVLNKNHENYEKILEILNKEPKNDNKQLSSFDYTRLGEYLSENIKSINGEIDNLGEDEISSFNDLGGGNVKSSNKETNNLESQLGIKFESLEKIEGFGDLSEGQQVLVINNLKQILSGMNHSEAVSQQAEEFNKKKWLSIRVFGKLWSSITKSLEVASNEKKNLLKIKEDNLSESDLDKSKDYEIIMKQLILGMKNFGPEVDIIDGKTEVRYANLDKGYSNEEKEIVNKFNKDAYSVSKMPKSWLFDDKHKDAYKFRMDRYRRSRDELLDMLSDDEKLGPKEAMLKLNSIDASLNINQYLNTNENVEEELLRVKNDRWYKQIASSVLGENGMYFASGAIARTCAVAALGASSVVAPFAGLAAVPVAGGIGLLRGRSRAKKSLLEKDMQAGKKGNKFRERRKAETEEEYGTEEENFFNENLKGEKFREKKDDEKEDEYRRERRKYYNENGLTFREIVKEENEDKYREERRKYYEKNKEGNNFVSGVDLTKKIDNHLNKVEEAETENFSKKHTPEELRIYKIKVIDQLKTRLEYTEKKIDEGLVSFSSPEEEVKEMVSLYESISKASIIIAANEPNIDDKMSGISKKYLSTKSEIEGLYRSLNLEDFENESDNLTKIKELIKSNPEIAKVIIANLEGDSSKSKEGEEDKKADIDLMKIKLVQYIKDNFREKDKDKAPGEDDLDYKSPDDERLIKMLLKRIRVDSNLESQLKKKAEEIDKARKKYLFKAGVFGAIIAGTFASAGAAIRHFYGEKIIEIAHETTDYLRDSYNEKAPVVIDYLRGVYNEIFGNGSVEDVDVHSSGGPGAEPMKINGTTQQLPMGGAEKTRGAGLTNQNTGAPSAEPSIPERSLHFDFMHNGKEPSPEVSGDIELATIKEVQILENGKEKHDTIIDALTRQLKEKSDQFGYKSSDGNLGEWASAKANNIAANSGYFDSNLDTKVGSAGIQHAAYQLEMDKDGNFTVHEMFKEGDGDFQSIERHGKTIGVAESTGKSLEEYEYSGKNNHANSLPDAGDESVDSLVNKDIQTNKIKSSLSSNFGKKYFKISNYHDGVDYEFRNVSGNIYEFNALDRPSLEKGGLTDGYIKINSDGSIVDGYNYHSLDNQINIDKKFLEPGKTNIPLEERDYNYYKNIKDDLSKIKRAEINNNVLKLVIKGKQYEFKIDSGYKVEIPKDYSYKPFIEITGAGKTIQSYVSINNNGDLITDSSLSSKVINGLHPLNSDNLEKIIEETGLDRAFVDKYNNSYGGLDYNSKVAMMDVRHICESANSFKNLEYIDKMLNGNLKSIIDKNYFKLEDLNVNAYDEALYVDFGDGKHIRIYDDGRVEAYSKKISDNPWTPEGEDKKVSDINIKKALEHLFGKEPTLEPKISLSEDPKPTVEE